MAEDLVVTGAVFEVLEDAEHPLRIWVSGSGFTQVAGRVVAAVGDVPVDLVLHNPDGSGFSGLLATTPPDGARLRVGWTTGSMADTDVTFGTQPDA